MTNNGMMTKVRNKDKEKGKVKTKGLTQKEFRGDKRKENHDSSKEVRTKNRMTTKIRYKD